VVAADLDRPKTLTAAVSGIERVLLSTGVDRNVAALHARLYSAAKSAAVRHVVRVSAIGASPGAKVALGRAHGEGERGLEESGLGWTHLRPHSFLQNFFGSIASIAGEGKIYSCMGQGRVPHVDVRDIAAVGAACLTEPGHEGKTYEITGPEALTMDEVAAQLGEAIGRKVEYVDLPPEAWIAGAVAAGFPEWLARDLALLYAEVFARNYAAAVSPVVKAVTGRDGITAAQFARDHAHMFRG
jgi:uncharacterized protein YbjT (DUF2867 family)